MWDGNHNWEQAGDEWSKPWGGTLNEWYSTLYPRLRHFLPAGHIVEIAPGFGRWTQFLLEYCDVYTGVDLSTECVEGCRSRFFGVGKASFHLNDGRSLEAVPDGSADLVFSFDSLVHVDADVLIDYLAAISNKLSPDGVAFLHHSNLQDGIRKGTLHRASQLAGAAPVLRPPMGRLGLLPSTHWRAPTVGAEFVEQGCRSVALSCVGQELFRWGDGRVITDCISVIVRRESQSGRSNLKLDNPQFNAEARSAAITDRVYRLSAY
jgi:hypothetical protein